MNKIEKKITFVTHPLKHQTIMDDIEYNQVICGLRPHDHIEKDNSLYFPFLRSESFYWSN
jgi:hypothetical protein